MARAQAPVSCNELLQEALQTRDTSLAHQLAAQVLDLCDTDTTQQEFGEALHLLAKLEQERAATSNALRYYLQSLQTFKNLSDTLHILQLNLELAVLYENWPVYEKAVDYYQEAYVISSNTEDQLFALEGLAGSLYASGDQDQALITYNILQDYYLQLGDKAMQAENLRNIIRLHRELGEIDAALSANNDALILNEALRDTSEIIVSLNNAGVLHRQNGDLPAALSYFMRAAEMEDSFNPGQGSNPVTLTNIGIIYQNLGDYQNSLQYLFTAVKRLKSKEPLDIPMLANVNNLISLIYLTFNDFNNAYQYNEQALAHATGLQDKELEQICYKTRSAIFEHINDYEKALEFYRRHSQINDSLQQLELQLLAADMSRRFSAEQTEKELSLLLIDREVEELQLRQELLENERLRQQQALQASLLEQERLERGQAEQLLLLSQQELERKEAEQDLLLTRQQLEAEQKDRQIALLEKEQSEQALRITEQRLESEQQALAIAQSERERAQLDLALQDKDFQLKSEREKLFRNSVMGALFTTLLILGLLYRASRIRRKANKVLAQQKQELEIALNNLKQAQSQLIQSEKMASLGELTAGIAHEINNPLNFVTTNAHALKLDLKEMDLLLEEVHQLQPDAPPDQIERIVSKVKELDTRYLKEEIKELIESIERGSERTKNIVAGLRIFSRKSPDNTFAPADLHEGLNSTLVILNSKLKSRIQVEKDFGEIPPVICQFDKLNQVFLNIINNSIQAIEGEGTIYLQTRQENGSVRISIRDTGKGMPESVRQRIFEPFFTTKEIGEGTGLGLSISYGIIEQHQGQISVNSEPGAGTEFVLTLPIRS